MLNQRCPAEEILRIGLLEGAQAFVRVANPQAELFRVYRCLQR